MLPGDRVLVWLTRVFGDDLRESLLAPTIADLQFEVGVVAQSRPNKWLAVIRGYLAVIRVIAHDEKCRRVVMRGVLPHFIGFVVFVVCYTAIALWADLVAADFTLVTASGTYSPGLSAAKVLASFSFAPHLFLFFFVFSGVVYLPVLVGARRWLHSPVALAIVGAALFPLPMLAFPYLAAIRASLFPKAGVVFLYLQAMPFACILGGAVLGWLLGPRVKSVPASS